MQKKIIGFLKKYVLFIFLLPVFYVIHGCNENFGFIGIGDASWLILIYSGLSISVYFLCYFFLRDRFKAALLALYVMVFYLFYGAIKDFLKIRLVLLSRYSVLLTLILFIFIILWLLFRKSKRSFSGIVFFFNLLFCIYLVTEFVTMTAKFMRPATNKFSVYPLLKEDGFSSVKNLPKPDIYFLVFDEYASSISLKENYGFTNDIDSFLLARNFHIQKRAYSNYNFTAVSLASILNSSYINGIENNTQLKIDELNTCHNLIRNNSVIKFLTAEGYNVVNYSIFDLAGNPSPVNQVLLPLKTRLITDNTALSRIEKDLGGWMVMHLPLPGNYLKIFDDNQHLLELTKNFSRIKNTQPDFVYAHFYMPHDPFYTDRNGKIKSIETMIAEATTSQRPSKLYLDYLEYTNLEVKKLIDTIQINTRGEAAIIVMGDHGFRQKIDSNLHQNYQVLNAVYLPGQDYHLFYDSISCVNQFRVVFNSLFKQSIPLLKDSTVFLTGKE